MGAMMQYESNTSSAISPPTQEARYRNFKEASNVIEEHYISYIWKCSSYC